MEHKQVIRGDYVITPIQNSFNGNTSYWISKKSYTVAYYCFTAYGNVDLRLQLSDEAIHSYITMFDVRSAG